MCVSRRNGLRQLFFVHPGDPHSSMPNLQMHAIRSPAPILAPGALYGRVPHGMAADRNRGIPVVAWAWGIDVQVSVANLEKPVTLHRQAEHAATQQERSVLCTLRSYHVLDNVGLASCCKSLANLSD